MDATDRPEEPIQGHRYELHATQDTIATADGDKVATCVVVVDVTVGRVVAEEWFLPFPNMGDRIKALGDYYGAEDMT